MRASKLPVFCIALLGTVLAAGDVGLSQDMASVETLPLSSHAVDLQALIQTYAAPLAEVTSDAEALTLYRTHLGKALGLRDTVHLFGKQPRRRSRHRSVPPPALTEPALGLTAELVAWRMATAFRQAAGGEEREALRGLLDDTLSSRTWLLAGSRHQALGRAVSLSEVMTAFGPAQAPKGALSPTYVKLAEYLDRTYPRLTGGEASWLTLAEQEGAQGLRRRLMELWDQASPENAVAEEAVRLYFETRLRPVLAAQVVAWSIRAEARAEQRALHHWRTLRSWREEWNTMKGLARLCGTWLWIVHNHQNHQDHKMAITFPPPNAPRPSGELPSKIVVLGDGVYLRWEFQGGFQEDSLLFTGKEQRLEGTFTNSRGPRGSITGKRTAPCQTQD